MTTPTPPNSLQEQANSIHQPSHPMDQPTVQFLSNIKLQATKRLRRSAAKALLGFMDQVMGGHTVTH